MIEFAESSSNKESIYQVWEVADDGNSSLASICEWLSDQISAVDAVLNRSGALLVRGLRSLSSAEEFEQVIRVIFPELRDYVGGTSPRERVRGHIMTATNLPPSWSIPLHQEMSYTKNPPDRIAFFCSEPATGGGGASLIGDMAQVLGKVSPDVRARFCANGLQLRRTLPSEATADRKPGVKKLWQEVFATSDREQVEQVTASRGWRTQWVDGDTLQLWQEIMPATKRHPGTGREVWFNQAHLFSPMGQMAGALRDGRLDDREEIDRARRKYPEMLDNICYGGGEPVSDEDVLHIYEVIRDAEVPLTLQRSDLLLLDNTLMAHGRAAFTGRRNILVALADVASSSA
jgi:alpha-ketoglutarate-dependent taurine dioxygenase